jgi:hypothetical protein
MQWLLESPSPPDRHLSGLGIQARNWLVKGEPAIPAEIRVLTREAVHTYVELNGVAFS